MNTINSKIDIDMFDKVLYFNRLSFNNRNYPPPGMYHHFIRLGKLKDILNLWRMECLESIGE